jgi:hypothetical protein
VDAQNPRGFRGAFGLHVGGRAAYMYVAFLLSLLYHFLLLWALLFSDVRKDFGLIRCLICRGPMWYFDLGRFSFSYLHETKLVNKISGMLCLDLSSSI